MKKTIIIILVILALGAAAYFLFANKTGAPTSSNNPPASNEVTPPSSSGNNPSPSGTSTPDTSAPQPKNVSVNIKNFAFSPDTLNVKVGTTVTWTNEDIAQHQVASDPHPTHTDLPGLVSDLILQGQSYSFTFTKVGTFGYHCHLHPSMKGTVVVTQ